MSAPASTWLGTWRNQYGSDVEITSAQDGVVHGVFRTTIASSPFHGRDVPLVGVHGATTIAFASVAGEDDVVVSYTGQLEDGRLETMWFVVSGNEDWWRSVLVNHDTFERVPS